MRQPLPAGPVCLEPAQTHEDHADTNVLVRAVRTCVGAIEALMASKTVVADRPAVAAGLQLLASGGDFADGVIALGGRLLGSEQLATFDRNAARLLSEAGEPVLLL